MLYQVGAYSIDPGAYEIRHQDVLVPTEPQVFELLVFLIENRERAVTKDEIIERVWKGRIVSDANLSTRVKAARQVLGDDGSEQRLIRTIHGRGFRFIGDVSTTVAPFASLGGEGYTPPATLLKQAIAVLSRPGTSAGAVRWAAIAVVLAAIFGSAVLANHWLTQPLAQGAKRVLEKPTPGGSTFDGRWHVSFTGNAHCLRQLGMLSWTIAEGVVQQNGKGVGAVSSIGELGFRRPSGGDLSRMVVFFGKLDRDRGFGSYSVEDTKCAGTFEMTRFTPPN